MGPYFPAPYNAINDGYMCLIISNLHSLFVLGRLKNMKIYDANLCPLPHQFVYM